MKKSLTMLALIVLVGSSACARRYTCPTYLKNGDDKQQRVQLENKSSEQSRN